MQKKLIHKIAFDLTKKKKKKKIGKRWKVYKNALPINSPKRQTEMRASCYRNGLLVDKTWPGIPKKHVQQTTK